MTTHALEPGCPVDESFDPLSPEFLADPFAVLGKLPPGHERPVFFAPSIGYYVVTRHAEIEQVFRDHDTYSAAIAQPRWSRWSPRRSRSCWRRLQAGAHDGQPG